jgi:peptide deformylase
MSDEIKLVTYPHPTLRHKSKPLVKVDAALRKMIGQMFTIMYENRGVGLAANQVGLPYRLFVMNLTCDPKETEQEAVFLNPTIVRRSGSDEAEEGCLSFPEIAGMVRRAKKVEIVAYTLKGEEVRLKLEGLAARAVQHETDHLDGVGFINHLDEIEQLEAQEQLLKLKKQFLDDQRNGLLPTDEEMAAQLVELEQART